MSKEVKQGRVLVVGSINTDLVARAPHLPRPGETIGGHEFSQVAGGKGGNQAVAAARIGARVAMIGRVGRMRTARSGSRIWKRRASTARVSKSTPRSLPAWRW